MLYLYLIVHLLNVFNILLHHYNLYVFLVTSLSGESSNHCFHVEITMAYSRTSLISLRMDRRFKDSKYVLHTIFQK